MNNPSPIKKCQALNCPHPCLRLWGSMGQCREGPCLWWTIEHQKSKVKHKRRETKTQNMPVCLHKPVRDDRLEGEKHSTVKREFFVFWTSPVCGIAKQAHNLVFHSGCLQSLRVVTGQMEKRIVYGCFLLRTPGNHTAAEQHACAAQGSRGCESVGFPLLLVIPPFAACGQGASWASPCSLQAGHAPAARAGEPGAVRGGRARGRYCELWSSSWERSFAHQFPELSLGMEYWADLVNGICPLCSWPSEIKDQGDCCSFIV